MMFELILKDMEQNKKALALFFISALGLPPLFYLVHSGGNGSTGFLGVVFGYVVFGAPMIFAFWTIGQEKIKGTLRLLRTLPVSGRWIIGVKSAGAIGISLVLLNLVLVIEPILLGLLGLNIESPGVLVVVWLNLTSMFLAALSILLYAALDHKIAIQVSYLALFVLVLGTLFVDKYAPKWGIDVSGFATRFIARWRLEYLGVVLVLAIVAGLVSLAGRVVERLDWSELDEN